MIQKTELRIGNLVYPNDENGTPWKVGELGEFEANFISEKGLQRDTLIPYSELTPIPLTPKILEKAGFVNAEDKFHNKYRKEIGGNKYEFCIREKYGIENGNCGIMGIAHDEEEIEKGDGTTFKDGYSWNGFAWHIKYVHQLQNLWHSITGNELDITL